MKLGKIQLTLAILISLAIACFVEQQVFFDRSTINDDVRNQIYWMAQQNDPQLFQNDLIASYFTQEGTVSPPLKFFYGLFPDSLDPKIISQFLPFILVILATIFLFNYAAIIAGPRYAFWLSFIFNLYIWMVSNIPGGLPRAFFYPLLFLFFYLYAKQWWLGLIAVLVLQTQIYPVVFFISVTILVTELAIDQFNQRNIDKLRITSVIAGIIAGLAALYFRFIDNAHSFGPTTTVQEALKMPEFFIDGRIKAFLIPFSTFNQGFSLDLIVANKDFCVSVLMKAAIVIPLIIICFLVYKNFVYKKIGGLIIPRILYSSVFSAVLLSILASLTLFYLYLPTRYLEYCLPLISIFVIGSFIYQLELALPKWKNRTIAVMMVISIMLVSSSWRNGLKSIDKAEQELYQYIQTLPKDILVAAPYKMASDVPAYAYRSVLVSYEAYIPFHKDYYQKMQKRLADLQEVYGTNEVNVLKNFIKEYDIDYIIIKVKDESNSKKKRIFAFTPQACIEFANKDYILISSQKVLADCYNR